MSKGKGPFKMPPVRMEDIIAQSTGDNSNQSDLGLVVISVGRPFTQDDEHELWYCSYSIHLSAKQLASGTVAGVDSLQALMLCFKVLQAEVGRLRDAGSIIVPESFAFDG